MGAATIGIRPTRERVGPVPTIIAVAGMGMAAACGLWAADSLHRDALWLATLFAAANLWAVLCTAVVVATRGR